MRQRKSQKKASSEVLLIRVSPETRRKLEKLAALEDRSLAAQSRIVIERGLERLQAAA